MASEYVLDSEAGSKGSFGQRVALLKPEDYGHDHGHERDMKTVSKSELKARMLEYFREVEQTAKARYPKSTVRIAFPIEPEWFLAGAPHTGAHTGLEAMEGLTDQQDRRNLAH